jgi:hypothetical protein
MDTDCRELNHMMMLLIIKRGLTVYREWLHQRSFSYP